MSNPNWTPKEPNRPFRPKPHAFGTRHVIPKEQIEKAGDTAQVEKLIEDTDNPTEPNGSED